MDLHYDVAYHLHCKLTLRSGRTITLEALHQRMHYAGWLEGAPFATVNEMHIDGALHEAHQYCAKGAKPYLMPPPRRDYLRQPGDM